MNYIQYSASTVPGGQTSQATVLARSQVPFVGLLPLAPSSEYQAPTDALNLKDLANNTPESKGLQQFVSSSLRQDGKGGK